MPPRKIPGRAGRSRYFEKKISTASEIANSDESDSALSSPDDADDGDEFAPDPKVIADSEAESELSGAADEVEEESEEEERPKKRARTSKTATPKKTIPKTVPGAVKIKLKPGEIFIPKKAPKRAGVDYEEGTIHPDTMEFLRELKANNDREWFHTNDALYRDAKLNFDHFVEKLSDKIITEVDTTIPELPLKDIIFRVHRDIRFSNDRTPYKPYFSVAWSRTGRKGPYGHYYLHVQPGNNFLGGGIWHAEAPALSAMRRAIDRHPERLMELLEGEELRSFMDVKKKGEAVGKFVGMNAEDALKTAPKGFAKDHKNIELLRLRSFAVKRMLTDDDVLAENAIEVIAGWLKKVEPLITYLNSVVMPDEIEDSEDNEEGSGSDEE